MAEPANPRAGGAIVALCVVAGTFAGAFAHQPSIGIIAGTVIGAALAVLVWLRDRKRAD